MVEKIVKVKVDCEVYGATLLSVEEVESIPKEVLECGTWWWLRSPGVDQYDAAYVDYGGAVNYFGFYVDYIFDCVRPAFILKSHNLQIGDKVEIYGVKATIISDKYALVDNPIGMHRFDSESNDYEKSEIKAFVDNWFEELKSKYKNKSNDIERKYYLLNDAAKEEYVSIITVVDYEVPLSYYISKIIFPPNKTGKVIADLALHTGSDGDYRFVEFDINDEGKINIDSGRYVSATPELEKIANGILYQNSKVLKNSILSEKQKKVILDGGKIW